MKRKFLLVILLIAGVCAFFKTDVGAQILQNTALYLRVMGVGTSSSPLNIAVIDCQPGDQYYACTTYTTAGSTIIGNIRVNLNGTPGYITVRSGAQ